MPLYEYTCLDCDTHFETRRSFEQANEPAPCPSCAGTETHKQFATIALLGNGTSSSASSSMAEPVEPGQFGCGCGMGGCGCQL